MVIVAGTLVVKPEARPKAVEMMKAVVAATKQEQGCHAYDFSAALDDPNAFALFELWGSREDLDRHLAAAHTTAFLAALPDLLDGPPHIKTFEASPSGGL